MTRPIITLLTDFGESDGYVGAMKGVMLSIAPDAYLVDVSHQVQPQNIRQAARILENVVPYYPEGTVHLVVVDPGVGSERSPIAVRTAAGYFVAPDNGVLSLILDTDAQAVLLDNTAFWRDDRPSDTFHGRDIFSPAAAHLAAGVPLTGLGSPLAQIKRLPEAPLAVEGNSIRGEVIYIDRFGNVMTNITPLVWADRDTLVLRWQGEDIRIDPQRASVTCGWHNLSQKRRRYSEVKIGERLVLVSSIGVLVIAVNQCNSAAQLDLSIGDHVTLHLSK
ncbi:MAG: S-adenosyl-l-methionine hydroxide adenosyltransferase family protein [Anaerolineae bacterium]